MAGKHDAEVLRSVKLQRERDEAQAQLVALREAATAALDATDNDVDVEGDEADVAKVLATAAALGRVLADLPAAARAHDEAQQRIGRDAAEQAVLNFLAVSNGECVPLPSAPVVLAINAALDRARGAVPCIRYGDSRNGCQCPSCCAERDREWKERGR